MNESPKIKPRSLPPENVEKVMDSNPTEAQSESVLKAEDFPIIYFSVVIHPESRDMVACDIQGIQDNEYPVTATELVGYLEMIKYYILKDHNKNRTDI